MNPNLGHFIFLLYNIPIINWKREYYTGSAWLLLLSSSEGRIVENINLFNLQFIEIKMENLLDLVSFVSFSLHHYSSSVIFFFHFLFKFRVLVLCSNEFEYWYSVFVHVYLFSFSSSVLSWYRSATLNPNAVDSFRRKTTLHGNPLPHLWIALGWHRVGWHWWHWPITMSQCLCFSLFYKHCEIVIDQCHPTLYHPSATHKRCHVRCCCFHPTSSFCFSIPDLLLSANLFFLSLNERETLLLLCLWWKYKSFRRIWMGWIFAGEMKMVELK